jgi:hypothetical protein
MKGMSLGGGTSACQHMFNSIPPNNRRTSTHTHTRSSSKAVAATFPDAVATTLPGSADTNSMFGGLTLIPEVPGTSEMPTLTSISEVLGTSEIPNASKKIVKVSRSTCIRAKCDWLSVGVCVFNYAFNEPSLISCQVSGCNLLIHHACQAEWENGGPGRETGGRDKFCIGHHPATKLLAVPERQVAGATSELMTSILNDVQQGLTSRRVGSILPQYSSDDEETEVKVSV